MTPSGFLITGHQLAVCRIQKQDFEIQVLSRLYLIQDLSDFCKEGPAAHVHNHGNLVIVLTVANQFDKFWYQGGRHIVNGKITQILKGLDGHCLSCPTHSCHNHQMNFFTHAILLFIYHL